MNKKYNVRIFSFAWFLGVFGAVAFIIAFMFIMYGWALFVAAVQ